MQYGNFLGSSSMVACENKRLNDHCSLGGGCWSWCGLYFRKLTAYLRLYGRLLCRNASGKWLSMGMSNDFEVAIQEGANMVRVGDGVIRS